MADNKNYSYEYIGSTHVICCEPLTLGVTCCDMAANKIGIANFVNGGYFLNQADKTTFPLGHLADQGKILSDYMTHGAAVTTLCVYWDGGLP